MQWRQSADALQRVVLHGCDGECQIIARLIQPGNPLIRVSSKSYPLGIILEDSLVNPVYGPQILNAYAAKLHELKIDQKITHLCFIEKEAGPVGALSMLACLVVRLQLPSCVYRASYWSKQTQLIGQKPTSEDRVALVYDLNVTGDGLSKAASDLKHKYNVLVCSAVVLFSYERKSSVSARSSSFKLEAIDWYDTYEKEIEQILDSSHPVNHTGRISSHISNFGKTPLFRRGRGGNLSAFLRLISSGQGRQANH